MVIRAREKLRELLKRNKKHVMVMFVCMNTVNTSSIQRINAHAHQSLCPSVLRKIL